MARRKTYRKAGVWALGLGGCIAVGTFAAALAARSGGPAVTTRYPAIQPAAASHPPAFPANVVQDGDEIALYATPAPWMMDYFSSTGARLDADNPCIARFSHASAVRPVDELDLEWPEASARGMALVEELAQEADGADNELLTAWANSPSLRLPVMEDEPQDAAHAAFSLLDECGPEDPVGDDALFALGSDSAAPSSQPRFGGSRSNRPSVSFARAVGGSAGSPPSARSGGGSSGGGSGSSSGGDPTGGDPTGGDPTGGDPTGGDPTGGDPTGGDPTSGDPTGGDPTGGDPTGNGPPTVLEPNDDPTDEPLLDAPPLASVIAVPAPAPILGALSIVCVLSAAASIRRRRRQT